jgi:hypothetical protein
VTVATALSTPGFGHTSVGDLRRALPSAEKQDALRQTAAVGGYPVFTSTPITGESERARSLLPNFTGFYVRQKRVHGKNVSISTIKKLTTDLLAPTQRGLS